MTWVKICGITDERALAAAAEGGADAVGFNFAEGSPRRVTADFARECAKSVAVSTFIVTVGLTPDQALSLADEVGADGIQNHGAHAAEVSAVAVDAGYLSLLPVPVGEVSPRDVHVAPPAMPLYDTASQEVHGGTGKQFDWSLLDGVGGPFVLAGGLGPDNIAAAVASVRPFGVDASSRLESAPGVKDPGRILDFIERAKQA